MHIIRIPATSMLKKVQTTDFRTDSLIFVVKYSDQQRTLWQAIKKAGYSSELYSGKILILNKLEFTSQRQNFEEQTIYCDPSLEA